VASFKKRQEDQTDEKGAHDSASLRRLRKKCRGDESIRAGQQSLPEETAKPNESIMQGTSYLRYLDSEEDE
jgi:hypothetical protein